MPVLLACSAFFSASETALFNLSPAQLHHFSLGRSTGRLVSRLMAKPRPVLNTILLGNMLVNTAYSAVAAALIIDLGHRGLTAWTLIPLSLAPLVVLIFLGEAGAKSVALALGQRLAPPAAVVLAVLARPLGPVLWVIDHLLVGPAILLLAPRRAAVSSITADEMAALMDLSARRGTLDLEASALLQEIVSLTELRVREVMVPRVDIVA